VRYTSFHSVDVVGTSSVASASPLLLLLPSVTTAESSVDMHSSREMTSPSKDMLSRRETTSPPRNDVITARCSETTATMSTALVSTPNTDVKRKFYHGISQQAERNENKLAEHNIIIQLDNMHSDLRRPTPAQDKIPAGSCLQTINDTSYTDGEIPHDVSIFTDIPRHKYSVTASYRQKDVCGRGKRTGN